MMFLHGLVCDCAVQRETPQVQVCKIENATEAGEKKKSTLSWVSMYLAQNYWLGTLYFTSPTGDGTAILRGHPSDAKV